MTDARQRLRLMQLASSSLPAGSFTWSQGLEWAVEIGWVKNAEDFAHWQTQQLEQNFLPSICRFSPGCTTPVNGMTSPPLAAGAHICWPVGKPGNCAKKSVAGGGVYTPGGGLGAGLPADVASAFCRQPALRYGVAGRALAHPADGSGVKPRLQLVRKRGDGGGEAGALRTTGGAAAHSFALRPLRAGYGAGAGSPGCGSGLIHAAGRHRFCPSRNTILPIISLLRRHDEQL